jgi:hypothetical protein
MLTMYSAVKSTPSLLPGRQFPSLASALPAMAVRDQVGLLGLARSPNNALESEAMIGARQVVALAALFKQTSGSCTLVPSAWASLAS